MPLGDNFQLRPVANVRIADDDRVTELRWDSLPPWPAGGMLLGFTVNKDMWRSTLVPVERAHVAEERLEQQRRLLPEAPQRRGPTGLLQRVGIDCDRGAVASVLRLRAQLPPATGGLDGERPADHRLVGVPEHEFREVLRRNSTS